MKELLRSILPGTTKLIVILLIVVPLSGMSSNLNQLENGIQKSPHNDLSHIPQNRSAISSQPHKASTDIISKSNHLFDNDCSQETLSDNSQGFSGDLHNRIFANDFTVNTDEIFTLNSLSFHAMVEENTNITGVDLHFYEDTGNGPGEEIESLSAVAPTSIEQVESISDMEVLMVTVNLEVPIEFTAPSTETTYWSGITIIYNGEESYLEIISNDNSTEEVYYKESNDENWTASSDLNSDISEAADGVVSFYGECTNMEDCTGQPEAGEIEAQETFGVCSGFPLELNLTGTTQAAGLNYQWQQKPAQAGEDAWTDIAGAQSIQLFMENGISETTSFRFSIECESSGLVDFSASVTASMNAPTDCYCMPIYTLGCDGSDRISYVGLTGESKVLDNSTLCSEGGFGDFTHLPSPDLAQGETYGLTVATDYYFHQYENVTAWIDFNENGIFDEEEEIGSTDGNGLDQGGSTFQFDIPGDSDAGTYRMRIRLIYGSDEIDPCEEYNQGETEDYLIEVIPPMEDCEGIPVAGSADNENLQVCAGKPFTLSVNGDSTPAEGLERIWQSSPAGEETWTDINGSNSNPYVVSAGIMEPMDFRYKLTCSFSNESAVSNVIHTTLKSSDECYCIPTYASDCSTDYISNLSLAGENESLDNDSECSEEAYGDYTDLTPPDLAPGETYILSVSAPHSSTSLRARAWIDFNENGNFESNEEIGNTLTEGFPEITREFEFAVPENTDPGTYRMRARMVYAGGNAIDACSHEDYGETEDYTVEILQLNDCAGIPNAGLPMEDQLNVCAGEAFSVSVENATQPALGLNRVWQSSPAGENNWTDVASADSPVYNLYQGVEESTDFRFKVTCSYSSETAVSEIIQVILNEIDDCYCIPINEGASDSFFISNVSTWGAVEDIDNTSGYSQEGYGDYSESDTIVVYPGQGFELKVNVDAHQEHNLEVWLDKNQNASFGDLSENIISSNGATASPFIKYYTIPEDMDYGTYRLRIRNSFNSIPSECGEEFTGEAEDYTVEVAQLEPCQGMPSAGIPDDDQFDVCANEAFTVSTSGVSDFADGLERRWQSSPAGENNWNDISFSLANMPVYNVAYGIDQPTDFRYKVVCQNTTETVYSDIIEVGVSPVDECYCVPFNPNSNSFYISNIKTSGALQDIDNNSEFTDDGYGDYTATDTIIAYPGQSFDFVIRSNPKTENFRYRVWVDWNLNSSFDDTGEKMISGGGQFDTESNLFIADFAVPGSIPLGDYRLRARNSWYEIESSCGSPSAYGEAEDYIISIIEEPSCLPPTDVVATEISPSSLEVSWTPQDTENQWELIYGYAGFDPENEGTAFNLTSGPTKTLTGLSPNTAYEVYVKAQCGGENSFFAKATFTTHCESIEPPFFENFESVDLPEIPDCDRLETHSSNGWETAHHVGHGFTGNVIRYQKAALDDADAWYFTRGINLQAGVVYQISYKYGNSWAPATEKLKVAYGDLAESSAMTTELADYNNITGAEAINTQIEFTVPEDGVYYFGFWAYSEAFQSKLLIDNIQVGTCTAPTGLSVINVTSAEAEVSWTEAGTSNQWEVIYGAAGFDPLTEGSSENVSENPYVMLTGLQPNTNYEVYVRSICSETNMSIPSGPSKFFTLEEGGCAQVQYSNSFENGYFIEKGGQLVANDFTVDANISMDVDRIKANILNEGGIVTVDVSFYENNNGYPGGQIDHIEGLVPTSQEVIGVAFGKNVSEVVIDLPEPISFQSQNNLAKKYWVQIETVVNNPDPVNFQAAAWEVTSQNIIDNPAAFSSNGGASWNYVSDSNNNTYDGVMSVIGVCGYLGVEEHYFQDIVLYPNPVDDQLNIEAKKAIEKIKLHNLTGQVIKVKNPRDRKTVLKVNDLPAGIYFITISINNSKKTYRIIKK